jgi:hypothetical protein
MPPEDPAGVHKPSRPDKARLADVFGEVLPDIASDERDPEPCSDSDSWLRSQIPPHHS